MSEFGERLLKSSKRAAKITASTAKPGACRIKTYDDDGKPLVVADFSENALSQTEAQIAVQIELDLLARSDTVLIHV